MPAGLGIDGVGARAARAVAALPKRGSDDLARAAIPAVVKLAAVAGHPLSGVSGVPGSSTAGGGGATPLVSALALAAGITAAGLGIVTVRRRRTTS